jgi:8-oxo-dGTP pyrophosphatase MutT (NUDIX family)
MTEAKFEPPLAFVKLDLPDGRLAVQRRTHDAPTSPNKVQWFGGHIEEGETLMQAALRELGEETNLTLNEIEFDEVGLFFVPKKTGIKRVAGLVTAQIPNADFEDYEGVGRPEAWGAQELVNSGQLVTSVQYIMGKIGYKPS